MFYIKHIQLPFFVERCYKNKFTTCEHAKSVCWKTCLSHSGKTCMNGITECNMTTFQERPLEKYALYLKYHVSVQTEAVHNYCTNTFDFTFTLHIGSLDTDYTPTMLHDRSDKTADGGYFSHSSLIHWATSTFSVVCTNCQLLFNTLVIHRHLLFRQMSAIKKQQTQWWL